jgi:TetR/AcrR family transcriptional regulator
MTSAEPASPPRRGRKRRDAAATQRRLLAAAEQEFAAHGFRGARLKNIAGRAGVQPALIHHYFEDKEGLYRAMLAAALEESSTQSWEILGREASLAELVEGFVSHLLAFNAEHHNLLTILRQEARTGSTASDVTRQVMEGQIAPLVAAAKAYLERLRDRGEVRADLDLEDVIMTTLALCSYPYTERPFIEACLPSCLVTDEESRARRRDSIVATIRRLAEPEDP